MLPKIVGVTGFVGCGIDGCDIAAVIFEDVLVTEANYESISFSSAASRECATWLGMTVEDFDARPDLRPMLVRRMSEMTEKFPNYWRDYIGKVLRGDGYYVVPDVSRREDAEWLQSLGAEIVRIVWEGRLNPTTDEDRVIHEIAYDWYVDGYGTEHLREQARDLLRRWRESS